MSIVIFNTRVHRTIIDMRALPSRVTNGEIEKQCSGCRVFKTLENFHKDRREGQQSFQVANKCKSCSLVKRAAWREKFKEREKLRRKLPEEKDKRNSRENLRYENDPGYRMEKKLRARMYDVIKKGSRSLRTLELLGADFLTIKNHLESQFKPGMTWESRDWHIDHRRPCASFDLTKESEQRVCFHYTNLQPLWAKENLSKGKKEPPLNETTLSPTLACGL